MTKTIIELDLGQLTSEELIYVDEMLYNRFHQRLSNRLECLMILSIRLKLGLEIHENLMISDYEFTFGEKFNLNK